MITKLMKIPRKSEIITDMTPYWAAVEIPAAMPSEELESITTVGAVIKYMQDKGVNA